jgi:transposase
VETAKANGVEPFAYLKQLFTRLAAAEAAEEPIDYAELLPWRIALPEP